MTSITDQVTELQTQMAATAPAEVLAVFGADRDALVAAGTPAGVATPGTPVPDVELLDVSGLPTSLMAAHEGRRAVLVFYRGAWCPYCNLTLRSYEAELVPALTDRDVALIAISPQHPDGSLTMKQSNDLSFAVLSDPGLQVAAALGILTAPSDAVLGVQGQMGLTLGDVNADGSTTLPMPTTAIIGSDGTLEWIDVHPDYTTRTEVAEILVALDALD